MARLEIIGASKTYASASPREKPVEVLQGFNLTVEQGEFVALFGPNGCGKSTLLDVVAGLTDLDAGVISIGGKAPGTARTGFIFQNYRETLLPWARVLDNIAYPLYLKGVNRRTRAMRVHQLLADTDILIPTEAWPNQLSGGQQQLLVIARALIDEPELMLFDEPFSALDTETRSQMQAVIQRIWSGHRVTTLFVSHDIDEALLLADRVVLLSKRPARPLDIIDVPTARPRGQELLEKEEFFALRRRALKVFREAVST